MSVAWTINSASLDDASVRVVSGSFRTQGASVMRVEIGQDFDAAESFAFGAAVTISRDGTPFFRGTVASVPKFASGDDEAQLYEIADAWEDLENTIYQEDWAVGAGSATLPRFIFGIAKNIAGTAFEAITIGRQIELAVEYAIDQGTSLQVGSIPDGETPIPSEMANVSCAEIIRTALKLHPDWIPWIDHATTPPTFHVTPVSSLTAETIPLDGSGAASSFNCVKRDDLLPDAVRIVYEFATTIDDEVYRNYDIDKYPPAGPDAGPRVMQAAIPLAGMQMQIQKSRIQTRTIPEDESDAAAKAFLIANIPHLSDVSASSLTIDTLTPTLVADTEDHPEPINPQATRLTVSDLSDLPRQLVRGNIEDWMRRTVGKVKIAATISAAGGASADEIAAIAKGVPDFTVTATNATTKLYKGITQWVAPEDVPSGVAQAVYEAIHAACAFEGSVTLTEDDLGTRYHGKKIHISGGRAEWATMGAPVHSVDFDIDTGTTRIGFGPVPQLAPQDFLELQRILRYRPATWWTTDERASNQIGAESAPSAAGDTVGPYDLPEIILSASAASGSGSGTCPFGEIYESGSDTLIRGGIVHAGDKNFTIDPQVLNLATDGVWLVSIPVDVEVNRDDDNEILLPGVKTSADDPDWDNKAWTSGTDYDDNDNPEVSDGLGTIVLPVGKLTIASGVATLEATGCGDFVVGHCAGTLGYSRG